MPKEPTSATEDPKKVLLGIKCIKENSCTRKDKVANGGKHTEYEIENEEINIFENQLCNLNCSCEG